MTKRFLLLLTAVSGLAAPAHAGWFGRATESDVTPDATLTIAFPFVATLGIDPAEIRFTAHYEAVAPDEPGVKTITETRSSGPVFVPVPFGRGTHTYTHPVARELVVKPERVRLDTPNTLAIPLAERLPGPGDYRLRRLTLECKAALCRSSDHEWSRTLAFENGTRVDRVPAALDLGVERAAALTAGYRGALVHLVLSDGSHAGRARGVTGDSGIQRRAVQDAAGTWHISDSAYAQTYRSACPQANFHWPKGRLDATKHGTTAWALAYTEFNHGPIHAGYVYGPDGSRMPRPMSAFTGCIQVEGRGTRTNDEDSEVREYHFRDGQLWARDIRRFAFGKLAWISLEFESDGQLLFYARRFYDQATNKEETFSWNRLEREAYPAEVTAAVPGWGADDALREGRELLRLVTVE